MQNEAVAQFARAAINLQKVYLDQQRSRQFSQSARKFYREQKIQTLTELSRYQFLFSDSYRRLMEAGSPGSIPDLWDLDIRTIILTAVESGRSYSETCREISSAFDRRTREVQDDPTRSDRLIASYEKELVRVYNDFGIGTVDIIRNNFNDLAETSNQVDLFQIRQMESVRKMLDKQVPRFWQHGIDWAEINLQQARQKRKEADIYIPANQAAVDALIERNLGYIKGMTEDQKKAILAELTEGMLRGEGIDQLVKRLTPYIDAGSGKGQSKAELIARTEVMYGLNQGALTRYKKDGIDKIQWLAGPDDRCCDTCINNDGKIFPINNAPNLPVHPNCRCTFLPVIGDTWVDEWSENYKGSDVENYGVYDEFGNLIGSGSGTAMQVDIKESTTDKILIHNHPGTIRADFSIGDLLHACHNNVKEMIVVTPTGNRCSISRPSSGWPKPDEVEPAWKNVLTTHKEEMKKISADEAYGRITLEEGLVRRQEILQPEFYKKLGLTEIRS
jgi:SPP1 gp7 family putative phage head morphogenesis protein